MINIRLFLIASFTLFLTVFAQAQKPKAAINTIGRYHNGQVELRFLPDKKTLLYEGIRHGFIIRRALFKTGIEDIKDLQFETIGRTRAFSEAQWSNALTSAKGEDKEMLELAKDYYDNLDNKEAERFSLNDGIKALKEAKRKEDFEYMTFAMSALRNASVAKAVGISFTDKNVSPGKTYFYTVSLAQNNTQYEVAPVLIDVETKEVPYKEREIEVFEGDKRLDFKWEENDGISGVLAERKDPQTRQWIALNKAPAYNLNGGTFNTFSDTALINYQNYEYRFYGYSPFGEKVLFGHAKGMPRDLTPPQTPVIVKAKHVRPKEVLIQWKLNNPPEPDFKGFIVGRGKASKGTFEVISGDILPPFTDQFIDTGFVKHAPNYYIVQAVDTAGNISSTVPYFVTLIDSVPPAQPQFVSGTIDSNGVVTLTLELSKEKDLMGFRLFRANGPEHEFSVIREGFDPTDSIPKPVQVVFHDTVTLNSLTPYIYYRAKALDFNFNQSPFSEILKVKRPDTIPPVQPVFKNVISHTKSVELFFAPSTSVDVTGHYLYRRTTAYMPWELIAVIPPGNKKYTDKKVKQNTRYFYSLRAKDDSGLFSDYAFPVSAKPYDDGVRPPVKNLKVTQTDKAIILSWDYPDEYKNCVFMVYTKDKKGRMRRLLSTEKKAATIKNKRKDTAFAVKVFTKDGGESKLSDPVSYNE